MNDGKKVYVISNSNTRTIDNNLIKRQEEIARRANHDCCYMYYISILFNRWTWKKTNK